LSSGTVQDLLGDAGAALAQQFNTLVGGLMPLTFNTTFNSWAVTAPVYLNPVDPDQAGPIIAANLAGWLPGKISSIVNGALDAITLQGTLESVFNPGGVEHIVLSDVEVTPIAHSLVVDQPSVTLQVGQSVDVVSSIPQLAGLTGAGQIVSYEMLIDDTDVASVGSVSATHTVTGVAVGTTTATVTAVIKCETSPGVFGTKTLTTTVTIGVLEAGPTPTPTPTPSTSPTPTPSTSPTPTPSTSPSPTPSPSSSSDVIPPPSPEGTNPAPSPDVTDGPPAATTGPGGTLPVTGTSLPLGWLGLGVALSLIVGAYLRRTGRVASRTHRA
jgi:hypothetical protein